MVAPAAAAAAGGAAASGGEIAQIARIAGQFWDPKAAKTQFQAVQMFLKGYQALFKTMVQNSVAFWSIAEPIFQLLGFIVDMMVVAFLPILLPMISLIARAAVQFADRIVSLGDLFTKGGKTAIGVIADELTKFLLILVVALFPLIEKLVALFARMLPGLIAVFLAALTMTLFAILTGIFEGWLSLLWDVVALPVIDFFEGLIENAVGTISSLVEGIIAVLNGIQSFVSFIVELIHKVIDLLPNVGGGVKDFVGDVRGDVKGAFGGKASGWGWW